MNDVENWPNLFTEYASAEILAREGDRIEFRLTTHPDPENDGTVWTWVSERIVDPTTHTTRSRRLETGPFEYMTIDWSFEKVDGGTRMRWVQDFSMKPGAPATDEQAETYMNRNTKVQMQAIKERLESRA
jgi:aromatase